MSRSFNDLLDFDGVLDPGITLEDLRQSYEQVLKILKETGEELDGALMYIDVLESHLKKAQEESMTDLLTEVLNRRGLEYTWNLVAHSITRSLTTMHVSPPICVAFIDIDCLKIINDRYGHGVGDVAIQTVAKALKDTFKRNNDIIARVGGDEFNVVLPYTSLGAAQNMLDIFCEKIVSMIGNALCINQQQKLPEVTVSIGLTKMVPLHGPWQKGYRSLSQEELSIALSFADDLARESKQNGKNKITSRRMQ
ncbi:MAG: GGDEF domain-containing protein [Minisyncoccota bacterium]